MNPGCLMQRPDVALGIALIASHWAELEGMLGIMYTYLLCGQEPTAFENYFSQRDWTKRRAMFRMSAKLKLTPELLAETDDLYDKVASAANERNTIVHGLWATTDSKDRALLLANPREIGEKVNRIFATLLWMQRNPGKLTAFSQDITPDDYKTYNQTDLQNTLNRLISLRERVSTVSDKVLAQSLEAALKSGEQPP
jgi:hypothetical protein